MVTKRSDSDIWLIGQPIPNILGAKLPTKKQVMLKLFYLNMEKNITIREAATYTSEEVIGYWNKSRIPHRDKKHVITEIEKIYKSWRTLSKHKFRKSAKNLENQAEFQTRLKTLFDISHKNAMSMIKNPEDKIFLENQRSGMEGSLGSMDMKLHQKETRTFQRKENLLKRQYKENEVNMQNVSDMKVLSDESSSSDSDFISPQPKKKKETVMSSELSTFLDRTKVSDRNAMFILSAVSKSGGSDINNIVLSRQTIRRNRIVNRKLFSSETKSDFECNVPVIVHWDGKRIRCENSNTMVEGLPILISGKDVNYLLGTPKLSKGTGKEIAEAVMDKINSWGIANKVIGLSFDTTSVNTGVKNGACKIIESQLNKDLLFLACRHHILEILLATAFEVCHGPSKGPEISMFKTFASTWNSLDKSKFKPGFDRYNIAPEISADLLLFCMQQLEISQPRDDYKELLELSVIVLGGMPNLQVKFKRPGPIHHARWMAKAIYALKMWLFRDSIEITENERLCILEFSLFVIIVYLKPWFSARQAASAPSQDIKLLKQLDLYKSQNVNVSVKTLKKFMNHLWYLNEFLICLALFDNNVSVLEKEQMLNEMFNPNAITTTCKKPVVKVDDIQTKNLASFVTQRSSHFFHITGISKNFLNTNPSTWNDNPDYVSGLNIVKCLEVVNDRAERGVAIMTEYNKLHTKNETQKEDLLKLVYDNRKLYNTCDKSNL